jgi:hypothetical protein
MMDRATLMARDLAEKQMAKELVIAVLKKAEPLPQSQSTSDHLDSMLHVAIIHEMTAFKTRISRHCAVLCIEAMNKLGMAT